MGEQDGSTDTNEVEGGKRPLGDDLIIPVCTVAFVVYYLYTISELPWQAAAAGIAVAAGLLIMTVILAIRFLGELRRGEAELRMGELVHPTYYLGLRAAILAAAVVFVYAMNFLGFTLSMFLFLIGGVMILSGLSEIKMGLIVAFVVSIGGYLLFIVFIQARFPHGPFENFVSSFF